MNENVDVSQEEQMLVDAKAKGTGATLATYVKLSGPGWLQSAITLGGGSLAGALFLGVIGGVQFLWIQLLAMILGVVMLGAIAYVTLSTNESPYKLLRDEINPVFAWGWLIASLMANMIWVLPQYALSYDAMVNNLGVSFGSETANKWVITLGVFAFCTTMVMTYGKGGKGQKIFDWATKAVVGAIVITFMIVAFKIVFVDKGISLGQVFSGFIPSPSHFTEPVGPIADQLAKLAPEVQSYWKSHIISLQQSILISAAAFAVGINMTFMMPFSLISRGWNKNFRGLATFDLATGMLIPFVLATSCVVIASAAAFHGKSDVLIEKNGAMVINENAPKDILKGMNGLIEKRQKNEKLKDVAVTNDERILASYIVKPGLKSFTKALEGAVGPTMANIIFGMGVLAMGLSTITMLMLISGFCVCELGGYEHGGKQHKLGTLLSSTGLLWAIVWTGPSKPYLAVATASIGLVFLPIAYISFFALFNSKKALGDNMATGKTKTIWNILMVITLILTIYAAWGSAWNKAVNGIPLGRYFIIGFIVLSIIGHFYMKSKHAKSESATE